jgi:zinc transport system substrate-binding protein
MRRMSCRRFLPVLLLCGAFFVPPASATVRVVATIFPLADAVRQIGGDAVAVVTLLPPGANPHTFEPTPAQVRDIAQARVFVRVGAGLDDWAAKLLAARRSDLLVVTVTDGVSLLGGAPGHGGDPHVWLDPILMRDHMVPQILAALTQADADHQARFAHAADEFESALTRLDAEIRQTLAPLPSRNYIAFHSAWRYFGERYGLHEVGVVESFPGKEPSARELAGVVEAARAAHVHAILVEPQFNPRIAQQVAHELGGRTLVVDPIGGPDIPGRNSYIDIMRYNLSVVVKALA